MNKRGWERNFDLVVASMTPAMQYPESLLKLMQASSSGCYYKTWAKKRKNLILEGLTKHLKYKEKDIIEWNFIVPFNLLYLMGYTPDILFQDVAWESNKSFDNLVDMFMEYFKNLVDLSSQELKKRIEEHIEPLAKDGLLKDKTTGTTATLTWKIS